MTCTAVPTNPGPETRSTTDRLTTVTSSISLSAGVSEPASEGRAAGFSVVCPLVGDFQFKTARSGRSIFLMSRRGLMARTI